jgi:hypothetical protein
MDTPWKITLDQIVMRYGKSNVALIRVQVKRITRASVRVAMHRKGGIRAMILHEAPLPLPPDLEFWLIYWETQNCTEKPPLT